MITLVRHGRVWALRVGDDVVCCGSFVSCLSAALALRCPQ